MVLRTILEVCAIDTCYEGVGRLWEPWWGQTVSRKQLSSTLKNISAAEGGRRWKSCRRGGGGGDRDAEESEDGAGNNGSRYDGTETGDSQVGK